MDVVYSFDLVAASFQTAADVQPWDLGTCPVDIVVHLETAVRNSGVYFARGHFAWRHDS